MRISDWSSDVCSSDLLVRSLASLEAGPAGRKGRHDRPGRSEPNGEVEMIDRNAAVIEQRPLDEALLQHLYEEVDITLGGARAEGDMVQARNMGGSHESYPRFKFMNRATEGVTLRGWQDRAPTYHTTVHTQHGRRRE